MMPFLTTMPHRLMTPMKAVKPKGLRVIISPSIAPNRVSGMEAITTRGSETFLNCTSSTRKIATRLMARATSICGKVSS
jgi:hypothetical protein